MSQGRVLSYIVNICLTAAGGKSERAVAHDSCVVETTFKPLCSSIPVAAGWMDIWFSL